LKGFAKIFVKAGETKTVTLKLTPEYLPLINAEMKRVVELGEFEIMIEASAEDLKLRKVFSVK